jgi:hypothetical protein
MEPHPHSPLNVDWRDLIGRQLNLLVPRSEDILCSGAKLGELLAICAIFAELEPIVRERATTLAMQKKEIPGWTLVHRDGNRYVEAERLIELCSHCPLANLPALITELATQLDNVSETRYERLCESAGLSPQSDAVKQTGATVFLRRNQKPNKER